MQSSHWWIDASRVQLSPSRDPVVRFRGAVHKGQDCPGSSRVAILGTEFARIRTLDLNGNAPERGPGGLLVVTILIGRTEKGPSFPYTLIFRAGTLSKSSLSASGAASRLAMVGLMIPIQALAALGVLPFDPLGWYLLGASWLLVFSGILFATVLTERYA